jgi:hypothetical protein
MSPLAHRVYKQLLGHVRRKRPSITYGELASALDVHPRSQKLHAALGEVSNACRHHQLPCLPAIVWRADRKQPSDATRWRIHARTRTARASRRGSASTHTPQSPADFVGDILAASARSNHDNQRPPSAPHLCI